MEIKKIDNNNNNNNKFISLFIVKKKLEVYWLRIINVVEYLKRSYKKK
jgi:hypothetical protein